MAAKMTLRLPATFRALRALVRTRFQSSSRSRGGRSRGDRSGRGGFGLRNLRCSCRCSSLRLLLSPIDSFQRRIKVGSDVLVLDVNDDFENNPEKLNEMCEKVKNFVG